MTRQVGAVALWVCGIQLTACTEGGHRARGTEYVEGVNITADAEAPSVIINDMGRDGVTVTEASLQWSIGDGDVFGSPVGLLEASDVLIVADRLAEKHIVVFDRITGRLIQQLGRSGQGPGEFYAPTAITRWPGEGVPRIGVVDFNQRKVVLYDVAEDSITYVGEIRTRAPVSMDRVIPVGDRRFMITGAMGDAAMVEAQWDGTITRRFVGTVPFRDTDVSSHAVGQRLVNRAFGAGHPSNGLIVVAFQFASELHIYDHGGRWQTRVMAPVSTRARFVVSEDRRFHWLEGNEMAYLTVAATDEHVFALFCGCPLGGMPEMPRTVHVFDWGGRLQRVVTFEHDITAIHIVDEERWWAAYVDSDGRPRVGLWEVL